MKKFEKVEYLLLLQLDSIYPVLSFSERYKCRMCYLSRASPTTKIISLIEFVNEHQWIAPPLMYGQDRLLYYTDEQGAKKHIKEYSHPIIEILKNNK